MSGPPDGEAERERLRARLHLRALLPLLPSLLERGGARPPLRDDERATVQIDAPGHAALLSFDGGALSITHRPISAPSVRLRFREVRALNRLFAGRLALPAIAPLRAAPLAARALRLLAKLRLLDGKSDAPPSLRVALLLQLAARGLAELHHARHLGMRALTDGSPDRVYQWSVAGDERAAAWLRMRDGQVRAAAGLHPTRRPFVWFQFPSSEAALRALTGGRAMDAVTRGDVRTEGSPEYSRAVGRLLQEIDLLLAPSP